MTDIEKGDISDQSAPRAVFVWEGLLAQLAEGKASDEAHFIKKRRWGMALELWEPNQHMRHCLVDLMFRSHFRVDILCTHPKPYAELLRRYLDLLDYPFGNLYNYTLMGFDKELAYLPNVVAVHHHELSRPFLFGGRGRCVANPNEFLAVV